MRTRNARFGGLVSVALAVLVLSPTGGDAVSLTDLLKQLPHVKSPRVLRLEDLSGASERAAFQDYGWTFAVRVDLDGDRLTEMAVAAVDEGHRGFIAVWRQRRGQWERAFFRWMEQPVIVLQVVTHPDRQMAERGWLAISASAPIPTEDLVLVFWCNGRYQEASGADFFHTRSDDLRSLPGYGAGCSEAKTR